MRDQEQRLDPDSGRSGALRQGPIAGVPVPPAIALGGQGPVLDPDSVRALQRSIGNAAVVQMLGYQHTHTASCGHGPESQDTEPAAVQRPAHYERAAQANARRVMRAPLDLQRSVEPQTDPDGRIPVQTMPTDGDKKPPPVPPKPAHLSVGKGEQASTAEEAAPPQAAPPQPTLPEHGYTLAGSKTLRLFRADTRAPEALPNGMRSWNPASVTTELTAFLQDPILYAQEHVISSKRSLVSTALDKECGGYASNDRYIYQIEVSGWYRFDPPPARSRILTKPAIYANSDSLETATAVVFGPIGPTQEMDFVAEIPRSFISVYRRPV
jgi:hypothetical protein